MYYIQYRENFAYIGSVIVEREFTLTKGNTVLSIKLLINHYVINFNSLTLASVWLLTANSVDIYTHSAC